MKKLFLWFFAVLVLMIGGPGYTAQTDYDSVKVTPTADDTYGYSVDYPLGTTVWSVTKAGVVAGSFTRSIPLPLMGFVARTASTTASALSSSTQPALAIASEAPYVSWADGEVSPMQITFRIPDNYKSGGAFKLMATETNSSTPNQVDFDVYVNRHGVVADAAATGQTPVALTQATTTPSLVTLTPATDFASLVAGDWITLRIWRDDTATGTGDLRIHDVTFVYTATQ